MKFNESRPRNSNRRWVVDRGSCFWGARTDSPGHPLDGFGLLNLTLIVFLRDGGVWGIVR